MNPDLSMLLIASDALVDAGFDEAAKWMREKIQDEHSKQGRDVSTFDGFPIVEIVEDLYQFIDSDHPSLISSILGIPTGERSRVASLYRAGYLLQAIGGEHYLSLVATLPRSNDPADAGIRIVNLARSVRRDLLEVICPGCRSPVSFGLHKLLIDATIVTVRMHSLRIVIDHHIEDIYFGRCDRCLNLIIGR